MILQVFQPLLLQYFTQQELRNIKQIVIKLHNLPETSQSGLVLYFTNHNTVMFVYN